MRAVKNSLFLMQLLHILLELQRGGSGGGACVCGGWWWSNLNLFCVCVGRVWIFCGIFLKHDFLIKIMTIDIFVNQAIYDTHGCSLQATMIHR